jgi:hypothetical protein
MKTPDQQPNHDIEQPVDSHTEQILPESSYVASKPVTQYEDEAKIQQLNQELKAHKVSNEGPLEKIATQEEIEHKIFNLIDILATKLGIVIPTENYPTVEVFINSETAKDKNKETSSYNYVENKIKIDVSDPGREGTVLAEETGHFIRTQLRKSWVWNKREDVRVAEFYGFLSRRLVELLGTENTEIAEQYDIGKGSEFTFNVHETKEVTKGYRKIYQVNKETGKEASKTITKLKQGLAHEDLPEEQKYRLEGHLMNMQSLQLKSTLGQISALMEKRNRIGHHRGYQWASKIDLSKIHNWKKLFSMRDRQVIKKFFRADADYSDVM